MRRENGFSLIELMIGVAISGFILTTVYSVYKSQHGSYVVQEQVSVIQQNLRGGIFCMQREIRNAGYDPRGSGIFGINDVGLDNKVNGTITFSQDDNLDDSLDDSDGNGKVDDKESLVFSLYDYPTASPDGILDLGRKHGGGKQLLAENMEAMGFAYAFDTTGDGDNQLDTDINGNVIWAIDSDNDKDLDVNLDTDNDGDIDIDDEVKGKVLSHADNGGLVDVQLVDIREVKIWLLARGSRGESFLGTTRTYIMPKKRLTPKDGICRRLLITTVSCRNMCLIRNN